MIYVSDTSNSRIQVFDASRGYVGILGGVGSAPGQLRFVQDIFPVIGTSKIYVADTRNHRIQCLDTIIDGDRDGIDDIWEILNGLDNEDPTDSLTDVDGDLVLNIGEYRIGTNPQEADSDMDGVPENIELVVGTDPLDETSTVIYISTQNLLATGDVALGFSAEAGITYVLQENADLLNPAGWVTIPVAGTPLVAPSTGLTQVIIPNGVFDSVKHYRIIVQ